MKQNLCSLSSKIDRNFEKGYFIGDDKDDDDDADDGDDADDDDDDDDDARIALYRRREERKWSLPCQ